MHFSLIRRALGRRNIELPNPLDSVLRRRAGGDPSIRNLGGYRAALGANPETCTGILSRVDHGDLQIEETDLLARTFELAFDGFVLQKPTDDADIFMRP